MTSRDTRALPWFRDLRSPVLVLTGCLIGIGLHATWGTQPAGVSQEMASASQRAACPEAGAVERPCHCGSAAVEAHASAAAVTSSLGAAGGGAPIVPAAGPDVGATSRAEAEQALATQTRLMQRALEAGAWTDEDATALRGVLPKLSNEDRPKALQGLAQAVNSGRLRLEASIPF